MEFNFIIDYKPRKVNLIADVISHKAELAATSQPNLPLEEGVRQVMDFDA